LLTKFLYPAQFTSKLCPIRLGFVWVTPGTQKPAIDLTNLEYRNHESAYGKRGRSKVVNVPQAAALARRPNGDG
jgi:hypothetical protein